MNGRSILVAGATGGLGSAITANLAQQGATLTLVSRRSDRLETMKAYGHCLPLDLRTATACREAVQAAVDHGGSLDVVVNAVGVVAFGPVSELTVDTMEELFLTNTFIPIMLVKAALEQMDRGGVIVNISGVIAEQNLPGMATYGASKAAVRSFDEAVGREARRRGIRIIDARPPHTETGLASRPIEGEAPTMPAGLDPANVAHVICDAIGGNVKDLPSDAFAP